MMRHRFLRAAALVAVILPASCARYADYDPLAPGATYVSEDEIESRVYTDTILVQSSPASGGDAYYFIDRRDAANDDAMLNRMGFGLGVYFLDGKRLRTTEAAFRNDLEAATATGRQTVLMLPPKVGDRSVVSGCDGRVSYTLEVLSYEDVQVPAGKFSRCLKIRTSDGDDADSEGLVWLAPGVGVVQWHRNTGRVDKLLSYNIPKR